MGNWFTLYENPFAATPYEGLDPVSFVKFFYPQMTDVQKKIINDRMTMYVAGVSLLIIGFVIFVMCAVFMKRKGIRKSSKCTFVTVVALVMMIIGSVLAGAYGAYFSDSKYDSVYQVLLSIAKSQPIPTLPSFITDPPIPVSDPPIPTVPVLDPITSDPNQTQAAAFRRRR